MRILVVTQYFWPENFRINDLCAELKSRSHEVTILTGRPNYPDGHIFIDYRNDPGKFSQYEGCEVVRVPMTERGQGSSIKLMMNYLSYAFFASFLGAWKLRQRQFDIIFVFEPSPVTVGLPAIFLKKLKKLPVVFWVLDLWPETLESVGVVKSKGILKVVGKLVSFIYSRCDLILGQSKAFFECISRYSQDTSKIKYFPSWSEKVFLKTFTPPVKEIKKFGGTFKILFAGNIGEAQDFSSILQAIEVLKVKQVNAKLFIVGDGRALDWVKAEVNNRKLNDYIYLLGRHPLETMPAFYSSVDALLVTLKESPVFTMTIPGKVQSYMAAGKPILSMLSGEGSRVIEEAECGYVTNSGDFEQLAANIVRISKLSHDELGVLGKNAKTYNDREFDRDRLISQLESWFAELIEIS